MRFISERLLKSIQVILTIVLVSAVVSGCSSEMKTTQSEKSTHVRDEISNSDLNEEENFKVEISMEEAINIAQVEAEKYYANLMLTEIHSYDNDEMQDIDAGVNGKRQWWYVNLANEASNYVSILIKDGTIINVENYDDNGNNGLFSLSDINITAEKAVRKAQEMGLRGGNPQNEEEWVSGYNFKLSYASLISAPEDMRLFLEVIGISPEGNFAHIDFDAMTGELLLAEEKIEYESGEIEWKAFDADVNIKDK